MAKTLNVPNLRIYLKNPNACPFCGSDNISSDTPEAELNIATSLVTCIDCDKQWRDVYRLVGAEKVD